MTANLSEGLSGHIAAYVPTHVDAAIWRRASAAVREAAQLSATTLPMANKALQSLASFGAWLLAEGYTVDLESLASADLIERFTQIGMPGKSESTRATRRAILRRVAAQVRPDSVPAPKAMAYRRAKAPYTGAEVDRLFALAKAQPTRARRRSLTAMLVLGLGCGLHRQDLAWVFGADVVANSVAVIVTVSGGPRPRMVPCLDQYASQVARCARDAGERLLIGGTLKGRRNVTSPTLDRVLGDKSLPRIVPARLRSTWLVSHLDLRTPLSVLLPAAGLASSRTLDDLLEYTQRIPMDETTRLLSGAATKVAAGLP